MFSVQAATPEEIAQKNKEIEAIQREIEQYQQQINSIQPTKATLQSEVATLTAKINKLNLEIKSLGISISKTNLEVQTTQEKIKEAEDKIAKNQVILGQYLRILYQNDQETLTAILLKHDVLSDFFNDLNSVKTTQDELRITIDGIQALKMSLEGKSQELEDKRIDLERQKGLEEINKRSVDQNKAQKDKLLKDTKGQESKFQTLVKQSQSRIEKIVSVEPKKLSGYSEPRPLLFTYQTAGKTEGELDIEYAHITSLREKKDEDRIGDLLFEGIKAESGIENLGYEGSVDALV